MKYNIWKGKKIKNRLKYIKNTFLKRETSVYIQETEDYKTLKCSLQMKKRLNDELAKIYTQKWTHETESWPSHIDRLKGMTCLLSEKVAI